MHYKEKLKKKYLIQKIFLINKVLRKVFKRKRSIIKKTPKDTKTDCFTHYFIQGQNDMKRIRKKIMQKANVNKRFTAFPTMTKDENHTIDSNSKNIWEPSNDFLRSLVTCLKIKFLYPREGPWECYHSKWETSKYCKMIFSTNKHENFSSRQNSEAVLPEVFYKKVVLNNLKKLTGKQVCRSLILIELQA